MLPMRQRGAFTSLRDQPAAPGYGLWPSKGWSVPKNHLLLFVVRDLCGCLVLSAIRLGKKDNAEVCVNEKPMCSAAILRMAFG